MRAYIIKRLIQAIPVFFIISLVVFFLLRLIPGDPALVLAGDSAGPSVLASIRTEMGLDRPIHIQYLIWLSKVVRLDLGASIIHDVSVMSLILQRLPVTLTFGMFSTLFSLCLALPSGIMAAVNQNTRKDYFFTALSVLGVSIPGFWLSLLFIIWFSVKLNWFPATGYVSPFLDFRAGMHHLVLPCVSHGILTAGIVARMTRSTMLEVLRQDYITTARGKGLPKSVVVYKHALKNAFAPTLTVIGFQLGNILGGAVIIEAIFNLPGVGQLIFRSIGDRDYPVVQGCILLTAFAFILINLLVDLCYFYFDPRIGYEE